MPITVVSAEPIEGKVRREIAIVSSLGEHMVGNYVLVRIADESGNVGLGEASVTAVWSGETQTGTIALIREVLAPLVVGADPFDSEWIFRRMEKAAFANSFARAGPTLGSASTEAKSGKRICGRNDRSCISPLTGCGERSISIPGFGQARSGGHHDR